MNTLVIFWIVIVVILAVFFGALATAWLVLAAIVGPWPAAGILAAALAYALMFEVAIERRRRRWQQEVRP